MAINLTESAVMLQILATIGTSLVFGFSELVRRYYAGSRFAMVWSWFVPFSFFMLVYNATELFDFQVWDVPVYEWGELLASAAGLVAAIFLAKTFVPFALLRRGRA